MSVYIVSNKAANHIVSVLIEQEFIDISEAQSFLNMMMEVNTKSVNANYSENDPAPNYIFAKQVTGFDDEKDHMPSLLALNLIGNFHFQSCEFDGYKNSLINRTLSVVINVLTKQAINWLTHKGYKLEALNGKKYYELPYIGETDWASY
ncbi:TPA: hypothetical protein PXI89_002955 [Yersinia enterocolitica]|jgi:hypothetical protein|nr:hypothetical protein [Yersinia enterocolitica]